VSLPGGPRWEVCCTWSRCRCLGLGAFSFRYSCTRESPVFLRYYLRRLQSWGLPLTEAHVEGWYRRYTGDATTTGKGEIFVYDKR